MDTDLREVVQIVDNKRTFVMFVFNSGVRELYDITEHNGLTNLEDVKKLGKMIGRDYNGNHPNPSPMPVSTIPSVCQQCGTDHEQIESTKAELKAKERELAKREEELDRELALLRSK